MRGILEKESRISNCAGEIMEEASLGGIIKKKLQRRNHKTGIRGHLEVSLQHLDASWNHLEAPWKHIAAMLEPSWRHPGASGRHRSILEASCSDMGAILKASGALELIKSGFWGMLDSSLRVCGGQWGSFEILYGYLSVISMDVRSGNRG